MKTVVVMPEQGAKEDSAQSKAEARAKELIDRIAKDVRPDAIGSRIKRSIQLVLESFAPEHVVTELLQNADDVGATFAEIELTDDGIFFSHNGEEFNEDYLKALCDIGQTTKKADIHIGFMGVGFKAVFKVSDRPHVFSGPFKFYFTREDVIVPYWLDEVPTEVQKHLRNLLTIFFLPFRTDLPMEIKDSLKETSLTKLEPLSLVFLKNIEKMKITSGATVREFTKRRKPISKSSLTKELVSITEKWEGKERTYNYLVFTKIFKIPESAKNDYRAKESGRADLETTAVTLGFSLKDDLIEPVKSVLYTFLPTPFETGLSFAVNCDFLLNTQRSEIDFASRWNLWLLDSVGDVLKEIVNELIWDEKQKLCFYAVLPRKKDIQKKLFAKIAEPLIDYMKANPLVLTSKGILAKPSEVVLVSEEVQSIIPPEKAGVKYYVHPEILGKGFLKEELGIKDLSETAKEIDYVLQALNDKVWLTSLDTEQVRAIYEFLYRRLEGNGQEKWEMGWTEYIKLENKLKEMEIVRSVGGQFYKANQTILPQESGKQSDELVDLPCLILVDPAVASEPSLKLLRKLGANYFTEESIVTRILESQSNGDWKQWTEEERLRGVRFIAHWLEKINYQPGDVMKPKLSNLVLPTEAGNWAIASACYFPDSQLRELLPDADYVDLSKIEGVTKDFKRFLQTIGVLDYPRILEYDKQGRYDRPNGISEKCWDAYWTWLFKQEFLEYSTYPDRVLVMCLDGFDQCVLSQDIEKLAKYLEFLLEHWDDYYKRHTDAAYRWFYYFEHIKNIPSYFAYQLRVSKWLPTTKGLASARGVFAPLREIRKVGGNLVSYLRIPEEKARQSQEFLQFLGIEMDVSLKMLLSILSIAKDSEVNDALKNQMVEIYRRLSRFCEDESINDEVWILDRKGNFQPSKKLYWLDDPMTEEVFAQDVPAAWVPDNMSRPDIEILFNALGVVRISSILERKRVDASEGISDDFELTNEIRRKGKYLYSVLLHHKATKAAEFSDFVSDLSIVRANQLKLNLRVLDKTHQVEAPCFCSLEEKKIYLSEGGQITDIARELARTFGSPTGSEFVLSFVLSSVSEDFILEQLRRSSIRLVSLSKSPEAEVSPGAKLEIPKGSPGFTPVQHKSIVRELEKLTVSEAPSGLPSHEAEDFPTPEVSVDIDEEELTKEIEDAKQLMTANKGFSAPAPDVWRESSEIDKVTSEARVVVRPFVSTSTKKDWRKQIIDGEKVYIESGIDPAKVDLAKPSLRAFRERMRKIVEIMGGNPDTVNICIANPVTDGDRRDEQLFFNALRNDKPLRWIVVAARELAYVKFPKPSQAHISLMADLIEKALERIQEIYPEIFSKKEL